MDDEHKFTVHEYMFTDAEHKFTACKYKIERLENNCLWDGVKFTLENFLKIFGLFLVCFGNYSYLCPVALVHERFRHS
jgi:hypothetical protein